MKCIECPNERNITRGDGRLRTRCRECWNKYSRKMQLKHKEYFASYLKKYLPKWRSENKNKYYYRAVNNKSNKKAIAELKDSYIKNSIMKGKAWDKSLSELIEVKRAIIQIHRHGKHRVQHQNS